MCNQCRNLTRKPEQCCVHKFNHFVTQISPSQLPFPIFMAPPLLRLTHQHDNLVKNTTSCILVSFDLYPKLQSSNKALLSKITYKGLYFATHERISKSTTDKIIRFFKPSTNSTRVNGQSSEAMSYIVSHYEEHGKKHLQ